MDKAKTQDPIPSSPLAASSSLIFLTSSLHSALTALLPEGQVLLRDRAIASRDDEHWPRRVHPGLGTEGWGQGQEAPLCQMDADSS